MVEIEYVEKVHDWSTNSYTCTKLGTESHHGFEEVLLPTASTVNSPVFTTRKFEGRPEYRWLVDDVFFDETSPHAKFKVVLVRRSQIDKRFYLTNIARTKNLKIRKILYPWAIVEVEYGHPMTVGKVGGVIRSNKRYVDTVQLHSMPKRRLAVVIQVIEREVEDLVQVVPISSRNPGFTEKAAVEVTSQLTKMADYQRRSWAICRMIQTVTASRIIGPAVMHAPSTHSRDASFRCQIRDDVRESMRDALMYGIAAEARIEDKQRLAAEKECNHELRMKLAQCEQQLEQHANAINAYEWFITEYEGTTPAEVQEMYQSKGE